jgi:hypothetical protein
VYTSVLAACDSSSPALPPPPTQNTGRHLGFDDDNRSAFLAQRSAAYTRALHVGYIPLLRTLAKRGVPQAARPAVWKAILGVEVGEKESNYLEHLHASLRHWDLVTDELFRLDVTITSNDDNYFVFEEMLSDTVAALSRDPWLVDHAAVKSQANERYFADSNLREAAVFPPCGVVPFRGIVMYATPICFLYSQPVDLYFVCRAVYAEYCCRLHTVSSVSECPNPTPPQCNHPCTPKDPFRTLPIPSKSLSGPIPVAAFCGAFRCAHMPHLATNPCQASHEHVSRTQPVLRPYAALCHHRPPCQTHPVDRRHYPARAAVRGDPPRNSPTPGLPPAGARGVTAQARLQLDRLHLRRLPRGRSDHGGLGPCACLGLAAHRSARRRLHPCLP